MYRTLKLADGSLILVDKEDFDKVSMYSWYLHTGYPARNIKQNKKKKTLFLHHFIMNVDKNYIVDHINGNKLDNRKSNLRIATAQQNAFNKAVQINKQSSKFKGVFWSPEKNLWLSLIKINGVSKHLGYFNKEEHAAAAYNANAKALFKEFARLNGVPENSLWWRNRVFTRKNSTGFRGVTKQSNSKWQARITVGGKRLSLGYFTSAKEAAKAYNKAAIKHLGKRALLNKK